MIEHKIKNDPPGRGTIRMLMLRPRTALKSKLARPNALIRTGEPLSMVRHYILLTSDY